MSLKNFFKNNTKTARDTGRAGIINISSHQQTIGLTLQLSRLMRDQDKHVFQFAGLKSGEGVTTISANIAKALAEHEKEQRILLIDANFQRPDLSTFMGMENMPGLSDLFANEGRKEEINSDVKENGNLVFLPAGSSKTESDHEITRKQAANVLAVLKEHYDYILIDSPPLLTSSEAIMLAMASDASFLVLMSDRTHVQVCQSAFSLLSNYNCSIENVILNKFAQPIPAWLYQML